MLEIKDLIVHFKVFEGKAQVLNAINLQVREGETVSIVGETGCGKSVTLRTILGILPIPPGEIVSGQVRFKGKDLLSLSTEEFHPLRGKELALIPQEPMNSLNPVFTIEDQFTVLIRRQGHRPGSWLSRIRRTIDRDGKKEAWEKALDLLAKMHIPDPARVMKSYPIELSGGMQQRVLIAMALAGNPSLLIADEPGTALDVTTQEQILRIMRERVEVENMAVLYITHNLGVAQEMTERIYVMYAGEIVEQAPTRSLFSDPKHPYTQGLLKSIPNLTGGEVEGIEGRIPDYTDPPPGCRFQPRCPFAMDECSIRPELYPVGDSHWVACYLPKPSDGRPTRTDVLE
ncbi:MAG: ABC transporter ATP-binding protein [Anaerolineales bacterium]